jgi:hypothetical protein
MVMRPNTNPVHSYGPQHVREADLPAREKMLDRTIAERARVSTY